MILLSANNITKAYGIDMILSDVSFHINEGDRIGLIGANGAGKTTLMKILAGEMQYDSGEFFVSGDTTIGYLKQNDLFNAENTVFEQVHSIFEPMHQTEAEMLELSEKISAMQGDTEKLLVRYDQLQHDFELKGGYSYKSEMNGILSSMAFGEEFYNKKISTLSGGERTRLALACMLLQKPKLLFLDEPTNHLDIGTLKWLEQYLKSYSGTILLISHDRYFLDQTVNRIFEIEHHKLYIYDGSYSTFAEKKRLRREDERRKYDQQQKEIERQEEIIRRFKQHGTEKLAKRAQSREKRLVNLDRLERPENELGKMKIHFKQNFKSGNDVLIGEKLSKSFGYGQNKKVLFQEVEFDIKKGERICIVGPNGIGKTTLLKIMMGDLTAETGYLKVGHNVAFGYYDQGQQMLTDSNTVLDELKESYRLYSDTEMRSLLGRFLFKNDMVFLNVSALSGGERARLTLLKLMLSGANVLLLDEPTNHLDIESKEIFEDALLDFPGTMIVISHDRYFLNKIPTKIFELGKNGINSFLGTYNYYIEKKQSISSGKKYLNKLGEELGAQVDLAQHAENSRSLTAEEHRRLAKEKVTEERRRMRQQIQLEMEIEALEAEIADFEAKMCDQANFTDHVSLMEWDIKHSQAKSILSQKLEEWLELLDNKQ